MLQKLDIIGSGISRLMAYHSQMSEIDDDGNIIIAGNWKNYIDILKCDGSLVNVYVHEIGRPQCVRVLENQLFVMSSGKPMQVIQMFWKI